MDRDRKVKAAQAAPASVVPKASAALADPVGLAAETVKAVAADRAALADADLAVEAVGTPHGARYRPSRSTISSMWTTRTWLGSAVTSASGARSSHVARWGPAPSISDR